MRPISYVLMKPFCFFLKIDLAQNLVQPKLHRPNRPGPELAFNDRTCIRCGKLLYFKFSLISFNLFDLKLSIKSAFHDGSSDDLVSIPAMIGIHVVFLAIFPLINYTNDRACNNKTHISLMQHFEIRDFDWSNLESSTVFFYGKLEDNYLLQ